MMRCPICGIPLAFAPEAWECHYKLRHPGEKPPCLSRKARVPSYYTEGDRYMIEAIQKRRFRKIRKYGWRQGA